jgi:hypothetical protein
MCLESTTNIILLQVWFAMGFPCFIEVVFQFLGFHSSSYVKHFIFRVWGWHGGQSKWYCNQFYFFETMSRMKQTMESQNKL